MSRLVTGWQLNASLFRATCAHSCMRVNDSEVFSVGDWATTSLEIGWISYCSSVTPFSQSVMALPNRCLLDAEWARFVRTAKVTCYRYEPNMDPTNVAILITKSDWLLWVSCLSQVNRYIVYYVAVVVVRSAYSFIADGAKTLKQIGGDLNSQPLCWQS